MKGRLEERNNYNKRKKEIKKEHNEG